MYCRALGKSEGGTQGVIMSARIDASGTRAAQVDKFHIHMLRSAGLLLSMLSTRRFQKLLSLYPNACSTPGGAFDNARTREPSHIR